MTESQNCVTTKTIENCYKKSDIDKTSPQLETDIENDIVSDWIINNNQNFNNDIQSYIDIDNQLIVAEHPTDDEIILRNKNDENDMSEENEENEVAEIEPVSSLQALSALENLNVFYETNSMQNDDFFYHLLKLETIVQETHLKTYKKCKQSSILDYLKRK